MKSNKVLKWIMPLVVAAIVFGVPFLFMGGFLNPWLGFLEPVLCPSGMHLNQISEVSTANDGNNVTLFSTVCTDGIEEVDITWKMILILLSIGIIAVVLFFLWPMKDAPEEPEKIEFDL